ncbi:MAG: AI-2E family transporter, partial [Clostridia bacterium]|nr:AI-2E family transporter [Clostridia bacterium]
MAELNQAPQTEQRPEKPKRRRNALLWVLVGIFIVLILANLDAILKPIKTLNSILTPIAIGLVLAYLCSPILRFFEIKVYFRLKRTANRAFSMISTYLVVLLLLAGVVWLIIPQLSASINDFRINGLYYISRLINSLNAFIAALPFDLPAGTENILSLEQLLTWAMNLMEQYGSNIVGGVGNLAGGALTAAKNIIIGIFVSIYVLFSKDRLKAGCRRVAHAFLSENSEKLLFYYTKQAHRKFGGFIVGKMVDSIMVGVTCAIFFTIFNIPYPILIAVIIGITDFIPFFGPFLGAIPSGVIIFITDPSKFILFVVLILVVQQIDGNLLAPLILGDHTGLSSLGVLVAITVMGGLLGFVGMLIGVPVFALLMTILDDVIKHRLHCKNAPTDLYSYYPADAFIRPSDEEEAHQGT